MIGGEADFRLRDRVESCRIGQSAPMSGNGSKRKRNFAGVTAHQVARRLGLSQSTVSRAFSRSASIHPRTRELIFKTANSLGYQPNIIARSLITRRTNIIAVVMANLTDPFYPMVLERLALRIQSSGRQLLFFIIPPGKHVDDVLPSLLQYKVDSILIASATVSSRMAAVCLSQRIPVVLFNRYVPGLKVAAVSCDNVAGGRAVADYLWSTGHQRPAFVSGEPDVTTNRDRARGFSRRLQELGMALFADEIGNGFSYEAGYEAARRLITRRRRPDCIFFASDVMAIGGIEAVRSAGLRVPEDVSVVGFDDIPMAASPSYDLTTVRQPIAEMVESAAEILGLDETDSYRDASKTRIFKGTLVVRQTVMNRRRVSRSRAK
ncbi:MAG: LacI family DNA-binding transcriptional regulator [Xanthobacteraceae bacterium]